MLLSMFDPPLNCQCHFDVAHCLIMSFYVGVDAHFDVDADNGFEIDVELDAGVPVDFDIQFDLSCCCWIRC